MKYWEGDNMENFFKKVKNKRIRLYDNSYKRNRYNIFILMKLEKIATNDYRIYLKGYHPIKNNNEFLRINEITLNNKFDTFFDKCSWTNGKKIKY